MGTRHQQTLRKRIIVHSLAECHCGVFHCSALSVILNSDTDVMLCYLWPLASHTCREERPTTCYAPLRRVSPLISHLGRTRRDRVGMESRLEFFDILRLLNLRYRHLQFFWVPLHVDPLVRSDLYSSKHKCCVTHHLNSTATDTNMKYNRYLTVSTKPASFTNL
jgi:hypothetical protein